MQLLEELFSVKAFSLSICTQKLQHPTLAVANPTKKISLAWRGEFFSARSFAHVNRESVLALIKEGFTVEVIPHDRKPEPEVYSWPSVKAIQPYIAKREGPIDVWIEYLAEEIPSLPPAKRLIYLVVWESFLLPQNFVETILQRNAEVWVASSPVYEACLRSKIPAEKIWLIPHGVDLAIFHPTVAEKFSNDQREWLTQTKLLKKFIFSFLGVAHYRKGVDIALRAFQEEFGQDEPVSLVIKDAPNSYGWGANLSSQIQDLANKDPRIIYLVEKFSSSQMASLYTAADVVLAPSRGEGFNLPIIEAMACGKPVISTRTGVACDVKSGILHIDGTPVFDPNWSQDRSPLTSAMWLQPDLASLKKQMRRIYEDHELRQNLSTEAQEEAQNYTWEKVAQMMTGRIVNNE